MAHKRRDATRADIIDFMGRLPLYTIKAQVWEVDGEPAVIAGYWMNGKEAVVFSDMKAGVDIPKITIWREAKKYMAELDLPARTLAEEGAEPFLTRLGWKHLGTADTGEVFEWQ